jgi:hypothetical protein
MLKKYRLTQIITLVFIVLSMVACVKKSSLAIINETGITQNVTVEWNNVRLLPDERFEEIYYLDDSIISSEKIEIRFEIPEHIWMQPKLSQITIKPDQNKKIYLNFDRAGLEIKNLSETYVGYNLIINEVYYTSRLQKNGQKTFLKHQLVQILQK